MLKGIIVKNISNSYTVLSENKLYNCIPRGRFRKEKKTPLVGDKCLIDEKNGYILELLERKNELKRPNVANIDICLIVTALKSPLFNSLLLDKEISLAILSNVTPVLCFTKLDLLNESEKKEYEQIKKIYEQIGFKVFTNAETAELKEFLKNKIVVLTGQTGAGKSTLINKLAPHLKLKTGEISLALNRGKHTTRHTEIYDLEGIWLCDTPGFSSLDLKEYSKEEIRKSFPEFSKYSCRFNDCMHLKEIDCGVKKALLENQIAHSRYENYKKMISEEPK